MTANERSTIMKQLILTLLAAFLLPSAAWGEGLWNDYFTIVGRVEDTTKNCLPSKNGVCWYDALQATAATLTTPILDVRECENFSFAWFSDITDNTATTNTLQCFELACATIDASNHCAEIIGGTTLDGDPTADNTAAFYGADAGQVYCVATMAVASSTGRIRFSCFPREG